jgi:multiubiquitin
MPQPTTLTPLDRSNRPRGHVVTVHVNERPVQLPTHEVTGLEIKQEAIEQGVPIQPDFILVEELEHGRTRTIGDTDEVHVSDHSRFLANDGDDNS